MDYVLIDTLGYLKRIDAKRRIERVFKELYLFRLREIRL